MPASDDSIGPLEYRARRDRLGFTGRGLARFVGVDERTERDWRRGAARVPGAVLRLFELLEALELDAARAAELCFLRSLVLTSGTRPRPRD